MNPGFHGVRAHWIPGFMPLRGGEGRAVSVSVSRAVRTGLEERAG
jgi:hypothetical protein